jgi:CheY-like chemotaxis protein
MDINREGFAEGFERPMKTRSFGAISIVDDDESVRTATEALLRSIGYEVKTFASAELFFESGALRETEGQGNQPQQQGGGGKSAVPGKPDADARPGARC